MGENGVEVIVFNGKKSLNEINIKDQLKHSNLAFATSSEHKKQRQKLQDCSNYQPCGRFLKEDFAKQRIMDCRIAPEVNFKTRLGFSQYDPIMTQEQSLE